MAQLVYLTGFMGSGKSTIAPLLAETLGYKFIDLDAEIERQAGETITEIFHRHGEQYFRTIERDMLHKMSKQKGCVIALGGGTIANQENLSTVKSSGVLIYLKIELEEIVLRLRGTTDRPLLESIDGAHLSEQELRTRVTDLLRLRKPYYHQADITVTTEGKHIQSAVDEIINKMKNVVK